MSKYGALAPLVADVGSLMAAGGAIYLAWYRGRPRNAPNVAEVTDVPFRVASVVAAVTIAALWVQRDGIDLTTFVWYSLSSALIAFVMLLVYMFLTTVYVFEIEVAVSDSKSERRKILGGGSLTNQARLKLQDKPDTTLQDVLRQISYNTDYVWTRFSRGVVLVMFVGSEMLLTIAGSTAVSSAAIMIEKATS